MSESIGVVLPGVSVVVVGHNEGETLEKSFKAINNIDYPEEKIQIIFVDSNSNDNSLEIAKEYAHNIVSIRSKWPTAGEAFNAGILRAKFDFVHITAGDIFLHSDYLKKAILTLIEKEEISAVTGFFVENNESGWNRILGYRREEDTYNGDHYVDTPNGGTFRKDVLIEVNGYDERIKKGQETEIGYRLNKNNHKIWHINIQQGTHDFGLNTFFDMASKYFGYGISLGHLLFISFIEKGNLIIKKNSITALKRIALLLFYVLLFILFVVLKNFYFVAIALFFYFIISPLKIAIKHRKKSKNYRTYFIVNSLFIGFNLIGVLVFILKYIWMYLRGVNLIEIRYGFDLNKSSLRNVKDII